jgi:2-polyprenyl-3-methyl-5-hydroxy-6-metoxy-1,4-benzoquinol methylase
MIKKKYDRQYYDNYKFSEGRNTQRNQQRLAVLLAHKTSGNLLEIGCGMGGFLRLAEQHFSVEGLDISKYAVQQIQPHFGSRIRVSNIEQHKLPARQYDAVVVFNILEHLRHPNKVIDRLFISLKPNGLILGSVPNNYSLIGGVATWIGNRIDHTHISTFAPDVWMRIFRHAGFQKVDFFGEVTLGRNRCHYLYGRSWPHLAHNLMFVCHKPDRDQPNEG